MFKNILCKYTQSLKTDKNKFKHTHTKTKAFCGQDQKQSLSPKEMVKIEINDCSLVSKHRKH